MDKAKIQKVFSDKEYVESILKLSAEDAAKSLNEKGVDVTADDLMKVRDFILAHKEELQNGELSEEALAGVAGGSDVCEILYIIAGSVFTGTVIALVGVIIWSW